MIASVIFTVTYGRHLDDDYLTVTKKAIEGLNKSAIMGAYWVEFFPWLKHIPSWVPGTTSRKTAERYKPHVITMLEKPYAQVKAEMVSFSSGTPVPIVHKLTLT